MSAQPITFEQPRTARVRPSSTPVQTKEIIEMLMQEELARVRIQEMHQEMRAHQARGRDRSFRRWDRVARWAARRADRHRS
ncbi:superfamily I DNA and/or RNA helicase [Amycolatopsis bartoniae]|uniref:Uncharacterized protein n=1 Tax=Amycolatopsis bartoniae TaxID=941986 RepID=A0A8H9IZ29_9PSEU|nr:hypothetical protein [Amycolatopsis bartoniae]MBB2938784.1 superfamily I DNA and/or RNA helicase [Amycolatopsis bartoniae]TVS99171.1 hypothetical protein FNH07_35705 [Amycolatopsis bartoniae]GHF80132.1 hypothetical protein GCM10017566_62980 [Amycolatopsis bartoniae]